MSRRKNHRSLVLAAMVSLTAIGGLAFQSMGAESAKDSDLTPGGTITWRQGVGIEMGTCIHQTNDVAGCQPAPFDVPAAMIPSSRVNASGMLDPTATEEQDRWGSRVIEERFGLFGNFINLHWVPLTASEFDKKTGKWSGGDLDAQGDGRALTISGHCLFTGHSNRRNGTRPMQIYQLDAHPDVIPPKLVGGIPVPVAGGDDTIMSARLITKANGKKTIILARDVSRYSNDGGLWIYEVDPDTCKVTASSKGFLWGGDMHEFSIWQDPNNPYRLLIVGAAWSGTGLPDPYRPGKVTPDLRVQAITDEKTGDMLPIAVSLAHFTLQDVGGPLRNERSDSTGLFSDGRYPNYEGTVLPDGQPLKDNFGRVLDYPTKETNYAHSASFSKDGKRIYVAGGTAGFYVLNSEAIVAHSNADLAAQKADCNFDSTNVWVDQVVGGKIDPTKYQDLRKDCLHMTVNDDPGVILALKNKDYKRYEHLLDKSRFDPDPSEWNSTGIHSAVVVPGRPSWDVNNKDGSRAAYVILTSERFGCPVSHMWMVNIEVDAFPFVTDSFGVKHSDLRDCAYTPQVDYNGQPRPRLAWQNHNPTVFKDVMFVSWYGHGVRALDISNPYDIREVGHAVPAPAGVARSYPVFADGLMYWVDNKTGLHVARYTGPYAHEIKKDLVYEGNSVFPHH